MNFFKYTLILLFFIAAACDTIQNEQFAQDPTIDGEGGISINVSQTTTRTSINEDDMQSVDWLSDDCIYVWAREVGNESYSFAAVEFKQKYYYQTYSDAVFIANTQEMEAGEYSYFGVYPKPQSVDGSLVSFSLSSQQSGLYDGDMDIMVASPVEGEALGATPDSALALSFSHLTHAIRINIPQGRNYLGDGIKKLEVTFPGDVVGDFSFDAAPQDVTTTLSNSSSVVSLNFEEELKEGDQYAWLFIAPCQLNGELSFRAWDNSTSQMSENITVNIDKEMEAGRITPITLTIPSAITVTTLHFVVGENYLGEDPETITITAPSGAYFEDGSSSITMAINDTNKYSVSYNTNTYGSTFKSKGVTISFESENAIVTCDTISLSDVIDNNSEDNIIVCDVPYLFIEDFSGINDTGSFNDLNLIWDDELPGLDYWEGRLYNYWSGNCIALKSYYSYWLFSSTIYNAHITLDLSGLTGLKSGKTVSLTIYFKADWLKNVISTMNLKVYNSTNSQSISMGNNSNASSGSITTDRVVSLGSCSSSSTITWETDASSGSGSSSKYDYIYIDNIKISIK